MTAGDLIALASGVLVWLVGFGLAEIINAGHLAYAKELDARRATPTRRA